MHVVHLKNIHVTFSGKGKNYNEIQANSLGWFNPIHCSLLKIGRSQPVPALCKRQKTLGQFTFLIKPLIPLGFILFLSHPEGTDAFCTQLLFFCTSGQHSRVMSAFSIQLPRQTSLSCNFSLPLIGALTWATRSTQLLKLWQFTDFSKNVLTYPG